MSKQLYTEEQLIKAIELARGITDGKDIFDIDSISGCTEICTYDWEEEYTDEQIIELIRNENI